MALSKITNLSITDDTIVNADINSSATIALSKLATDPSNASNLASGTVPTARLGTGSASSSVFLAGDSTWIAAGGGKVLQAVTFQFTTSTASSSTSWIATGLTVDITPSATSSKVLVLVTDSSLYHDAGSNFQMTVNRDVTNLGHATYGYMYGYGKGDGETFCATILDSPSTTSAVTYEVYAKNSGGTLYWSNGNAHSNITAIEIGA